MTPTLLNEGSTNRYLSKVINKKDRQAYRGQTVERSRFVELERRSRELRHLQEQHQLAVP